MSAIGRLFFDTNVYIVGAIDEGSDESKILRWSGWGNERDEQKVEVIISSELIAQILRVAKRLRNKDWAGDLVMRVWSDLNTHYVLLDTEDSESSPEFESIPREDVMIYLTAKLGETQVFVSANHALVRALLQRIGEFECLTPAEFVKKYVP